MSETEKVLKKETEVIILNDINSVFFKFVIVKEGKVIFKRDRSKRIDFELKTMQEYYDFQPFIKEYNEAYIQRSFQEFV